MPARKEALEVAGREVTVSNPDKVFFPKTGHTKLDLVRYYLSVAYGALRGIDGRPMALKRYVNGAEGEFFFQKRAPTSRPDWIEVVELSFPSGRTAEEIVVRDAAQLVWVINLGCIDLNPHPVRAEDLDHPDELRVDLDPIPGVSTPLSWDEVPGIEPDAFTVDTVPKRFTEVGDPFEPMDDASDSLERLLELSAQHEEAGFGDAPWPPHFAKQAGEPPRVQPSKRRTASGKPERQGVVPPPAPGKRAGPTGRRRTTMPLIEVARASTEAEAREGLERWKGRHPEAWTYLGPADVLVDSMRGRSSTWTRIRLKIGRAHV